MNRSAKAFALGARIRVLMILIPAVAKTASKGAVNLAPLSRIKNVARATGSDTSKQKLRACWVTKPLTGLAVTPARWTRRVSSSMTNSTT